jgi:hypothetical protein
MSEFPAIILAIHCISCQFPSKKDFLPFFLPELNISFCLESSLSYVTPGSSQTLVDERQFYENRCLEPHISWMKRENQKML